MFKKINFLVKTPNVSPEFETICFKVGLSKDPKATFEALDKDVSQEISKLVKEYCFDKYYQDFFNGVLQLAQLSVLHTIKGFVCNNYNEYIDDIISDCYDAALGLVTPNKDGIIKYSPDEGAFRSYSKRLIEGAAADSHSKHKSPLSFTKATIRKAKQIRADLNEFYFGDIPDIETVVEEYYGIPRSSGIFKGKVKSLNLYLSIYDKSISINTKTLKGEGDELMDMLESTDKNAEEKIVETELYKTIRDFIKEYDQKTITIYLRLKLRDVNTQYTVSQAAKDLGINRVKMYEIIHEIDDILRNRLSDEGQSK